MAISRFLFTPFILSILLILFNVSMLILFACVVPACVLFYRSMLWLCANCSAQACNWSRMALAF